MKTWSSLRIALRYRWLQILLFLELLVHQGSSNPQQNLRFSSGLLYSVCEQQNEYTRTQALQPPSKSPLSEIGSSDCITYYIQNGNYGFHDGCALQQGNTSESQQSSRAPIPLCYSCDPCVEDGKDPAIIACGKELDYCFFSVKGQKVSRGCRVQTKPLRESVPGLNCRDFINKKGWECYCREPANGCNDFGALHRPCKPDTNFDDAAKTFKEKFLGSQFRANATDLYQSDLPPASCAICTGENELCDGKNHKVQVAAKNEVCYIEVSFDKIYRGIRKIDPDNYYPDCEKTCKSGRSGLYCLCFLDFCNFGGLPDPCTDGLPDGTKPPACKVRKPSST